MIPATPATPATPLPDPQLQPPPRDREGDVGRGVALVLAAAEVRLVRGLDLAEHVRDPDLAVLRGQARGLGLTMRTRWFHGGALGRLVLATIDVDGVGPRSATLIALPDPARGLPILAVDLIALGGALSLAAIDLAPVDDAIWEQGAAPLLEQAHARVRDRVVHRRWPDFAHEVFSPRALICGARPGGEEAVFAAAVAVVGGYAELAATAPPALASARTEARRRQRIQAWRAAERRNRREHDALARIFGAEVAGRYLADLFGEEGGDA